MKCLFLVPVILVVSLLLPCTAGAEKHALLVGVTEYPSLDPSQWLKGPENDVALAREVLTGPRFQVPEKNVMTLTAWPDDKSQRPTRGNIAKAFAALAKKAGKADVVFILMSGHGSQQPANPQEGDLEPDGLDEVFLPADTTTWNPEKGTIEGAIVDDEIKVWTDAIRRKGAFVWIVFDSCHSGTMTRGTEATGRVNRRIDPALLIPREVSGPSPTATGTVQAETTGDLAGAAPDEMGGLVAMYAAQSLEPTFELPIPQPYGPQRGLFTTTILNVISGAPGTLSYRDLSETIDVIYRSNGILQPTPLIEGDGMDQPVLGVGTAPPRRDILFTGLSTPKGFQINSGHLRGTTKGSILEVFPAAVVNSEKSLGTVRVVSVEATTAIVVPHPFEGRKAAPQEELGPACRATVVYQELGLSTMKVALQTKADKKDWVTIDPATKEEPAAALIAEIKQEARGFYELVADARSADWIVQLNEKGLGQLIPACGESAADRGSRAQELTRKSLMENLAKIARTRQLLNIAGTGTGTRGLSLSVELVRFDPPGSSEGKVVPRDGTGRILKAGDEIAFRLKNNSRVATDVTLLHVGEDYAISAVFPEPATTDDNRIAPGQTLETPRMTVTADRTLREQLVVLATRAARERHDFSCLEQESLEVTRGASLESPLGKLLRSRMYGGESSRGLTRAETGNYATRLLTWTAVPAE